MIRPIKDDCGSLAVEAALILPVFLLMVAGGLHYGMAQIYKHRLDYAVEAASRCAGLGRCADDNTIIAYAADRASIGNASFSTSLQGCGAQVDASLDYDLVAIFPAITLTASGCYPISGTGTLGPIVKVAQLPTCNQSLNGEMWRVSDATTPTYENHVGAGSVVQGGGTNLIPVVCDATDPGNMNWTAH